MEGDEPSSPRDPATVDIAIVTVQFNNFVDTKVLAANLAGLEGTEKCELVVVDNSSQGDASADLSALADAAGYRVRILRPPANLYYWGGAEYALRSLYDASDRRPLWVVVCNNDITIEDQGFLNQLRSLDPLTFPIVAPGITSAATGRQQNPLLRSRAGPLRRLKWRIYDIDYRVAKTLLGVRASVSGLLGSFVRDPRTEELSQSRERIYAPHGACMIFSAAFFERGGRLDATVPMFAEELTIAALAQRLKMPVWYCPELKVLHREHSTTGHRLTREKYEMERLARRHYFGLAQQ